MTWALEMRGISKRYPGTLAVDEVDFAVRPGEVHALMGENGAGKSTLMKALAGAFADYTGSIIINGKEIALHSPAAAKEHGVGMVYQELSLARPISIAENVLVGRWPVTRAIYVDRVALLDEARRCLDQVGLDLDPLRTIEDISPHEAQLVEIAKVLGNHPHILVMDEPTSALSKDEVHRLFEILRRLKREGLAIVYISHHLSEIFAIADRVTVLRDGKLIGTRDIKDVTPRTLVQMMVGQTIDSYYTQRQPKIGGPVLRVRNLTRRGFFTNISFQAHRGEILGIAGLAGSGRSELARSICGLDPVHAGQVELEDAALPAGDYPGAVERGLVYMSEDRKVDGLFPRLSVKWNLLAALVGRHSRAGIYFSGHDQPVVQELLEKLQVVAASPDADVGTLSGGNQQKVFLGKWLATKPKVLILDEPSRGVDVKAKMRIHEAVMELADKGHTVLLISSDLAELVGLSDRAIVLRNGHLLGELGKAELSEEAVLLAANGEGKCRHD